MIRGSMVALITPFNEDGSVNYKRLRELIDWHVDQQTDAILVLGTTAETPTLTVSEEDEIARISIEQAKGRVPIIVGSGSNNTMVAIEQSLKYEKMGADGLLVITPYYNKASKAGMVNHFMQVADAVHTPVYVYNVPGRTGVSLTYEALAEISQHKNIVGIKEASGNMSLICQFSKLINENFNVYSGNDDINVALMSMGGAGSISVMANILPKEVHDIAMACQNGIVIYSTKLFRPRRTFAERSVVLTVLRRQSAEPAQKKLFIISRCREPDAACDSMDFFVRLKEHHLGELYSGKT